MTIVRFATVLLVAVAGYLLGSVPVAVLVGRRHRIDPRTAGDRNPGYWNMKETVGRRAAIPVFVGDTVKGAAAALVGRCVDGPWWVGYVAVAAAMIGHAWPVFAGFRGGRSILTFAGGVIVLAPVASALAIVGLLVVMAAWRSFALGARVGVFGFPLAQSVVEPRAHVAASGLLMSIIGLRFALAWRSRTKATPGEPEVQVGHSA